MMTETSNDDKIEILPPGATRKKVKHACYQCKMAHAACDIQRPCKRCISMGLAGDCRDPDPKKRARNVTPLVQRRIQNSWPEDQRPIRQEEKRLRFSSSSFEDLGSHDLGLIENRLNDWSTENGMYTLGPTPIKNEQIDPDIVISEAPASTATPMESTSSNGLAATNLFYPTTTTTTTGFSHSKPQPIPGRSPRAKSPRGSPKNNVTFPTPSFLSQQPPLSQSHPPPASPAPFNPLSTTPNNNTTTTSTTQKRTPPSRTFSFDQFPSGGGNAFKPPAPVSPMVPSDDLSDAEKTTTSILQTILSELKEVKQSHHELMKEQQALRGEILHLQSSPPTTPTSPPGLYPGFATPPTTTSSTAPTFGPPEGGFNFGSARDNGSPQSPIFIPNSPSLSTAGFTPPASPAFNLPSHTSQGNSFFSGYNLPPQQDNNKNPDNIALFSPVSRPMTSSPNNNNTTTTTTSTALGFPENSGVMHFPIKSMGGAPRDPSKTIPYWRPTNLPTIHAPRRATAPFKAASLPSTVPTPSNHRFSRSNFEGGFGAFDLPSTAPSSPSPFSSVHSVDMPLNPQTTKGASNPHLSSRPPTTTPPSSSSTTATTSTSSTPGVPNRTPFAIEDPTKPFAILARNGADVVFTMVNDPFCRLYNYQRNELIGKSWRMVLPNTQQDICEGFFRRLLAKRSPGPASEIMSVSLPNQTKDGIIFDTRSRHQIFYDDAGHLSWNIVYIESHSLPTPDQFLSVFQEPTPSPSPLSSSSLSTPIPTNSTSTTQSVAYPSPISASFPPSPGYSNLFTPDSNPYSPLDSYLQPATPFMTNALPTGDTSSPHTPFGLPDLNQYQNGNAGSSASSSTDISDYFNQSLTPFISFDSVPMENTDNNTKPNTLLSELTSEQEGGRNRKEEVDSFGCLQELLQFEPLKKEESSDGMNLPASSENKKDGNDGNGFGEEQQQQQQMEGKEYGAANDEEVEKEFEDMMRDSTDGSFGVFFSDENLTKDI